MKTEKIPIQLEANSVLSELDFEFKKLTLDRAQKIAKELGVDSICASHIKRAAREAINVLETQLAKEDSLHVFRISSI